MSHREISLEELISYLQGTASEPLKKEIDSQRKSDEEFEEELQGWEDYIEDHSDREEAIQHIMAIHQKWKSTPIVEVASPSPAAASVKSLWARPTLWLAVAAAVAVLLLSTGIISWSGAGGVNYEQLASQEIDKELSRMLNVTASVDPQIGDSDDWQAALQQAYASQGDSGLVKMIDAMAPATRTEEIKLIHALALSRTQAKEEALWILDTLATESTQEDIRCNSIWNGFWIALETEKSKAKNWVLKWNVQQRGINCPDAFPAKNKKIKEVMVSF
ncbi:MAG: hypothetical protein AAFP89_23845 [Bacteroidota bacterium]